MLFQAVTAIIGSEPDLTLPNRIPSGADQTVLVSLPRTFNHVSTMGIVSAVCMGIAIILSLVYAGIEDHPVYGYGGNYPELGEVTTSTTVPGKPTFVNAFNAVLKYVGQYDLWNRALSVTALHSYGSVRSCTHPSSPKWSSPRTFPRLSPLSPSWSSFSSQWLPPSDTTTWANTRPPPLSALSKSHGCASRHSRLCLSLLW